MIKSLLGIGILISIIGTTAQADIAVKVMSCSGKTHSFFIRKVMGMPQMGRPGSGTSITGFLSNKADPQDTIASKMKKKNRKQGIIARYDGDLLSIEVSDQSKGVGYASVLTVKSEDTQVEIPMICVLKDDTR